MDGPSYTRTIRGRGGAAHDPTGARSRPQSRNKHWSATDADSRGHTPNHSDSERWERGGHRGGGRGRGTRGTQRIYHNVSLKIKHSSKHQEHPVTPVPTLQNDEFYDEEEDELHGDDNMDEEIPREFLQEIHEPDLDKPEDREKFYQELVKAREVERKTAIAEGKMDDPLVPKRLEDAISIVGTCMDMCPRFERYRRERENNLFEWETIPGTKRVDHNRAVKMYERAAGDKTLPSDLRPPHVLKRTLDYLFHDLLPRGGFSATFNFIRDRSRAVRNDFTMQHITGALAIECHDRCARFHILALHFERDRTGFSVPLEEQQLMNTLQSLKEFYEDQRRRYASPTELEMRVYHRLIHIRDQKERHEDIPDHITSHPVFKLTTEFRQHVQAKSAPITKTSKLVVTEEGMQIFSQLAQVLVEQGSTVMVYLVACLLERLFGKDTIDDIESIKGDLSISDIIDGVSSHGHIEGTRNAELEEEEEGEQGEEQGEDYEEEDYDEEQIDDYEQTDEVSQPAPLQPNPAQWPSSSVFAPQQPLPSTLAPSSSKMETPPVANSAFGGLVATPNVFGTVFGPSPFSTSSQSSSSIFGKPAGQPSSVFGNSFGVSTPSQAHTPAHAPVPQPPAAVPTPMQSQINGYASSFPPKVSAPSAPQPNFFNSTPTPTPVVPTAQPPATQSSPSTSVFGGASNASPFTNPFANSNAASSSTPSPFNLPGPPNGASSSTFLNPQALEFTPHQPTKSSIFSQPLAAPAPQAKSDVSPSVIPLFTPPPTTAATAPSNASGLNGPSNGFSTPSSIPPSLSQTPPPSFFTKPNHRSSKSTTPPANRPIAPPLLKIDTNTSIGSNSSSSSTVASPRVPPPLPRQQPISLPSTPTMVLQPPNPLLGHLKNTLTRSPSGSQQDVLSPLIIGSPTLEDSKPFTNFSPISTPKILRKFSLRAPSPPLNSNTNSRKGKAPERHYSIEEVEEMKAKAAAFGQRTLLTKEYFELWVQRTTDRIAYLEARRHGDEYKERLQRSTNGRPNQLRPVAKNGLAVLDKKRRISSNGLSYSEGQNSTAPVKKRARKSEYKPPRTDEDLAKRLKENHQEHEQRWAPGSFLQTIRKHVKAVNPSTLKMPWSIWLSMNPESDATAIWLERKFDVPNSGSWASESVFSIPLSSAPGPGVSGYPGLIVFECTPLGDVTDDLEKKYRILDDCSRLREIMKNLSPQRHFIPSLLIICWSEPEEISSTSDFFEMVKKLTSDSILQSYHLFAMTSSTKALDSKLDAALKLMTLDTEGKLVQTLSLKDVFKLFEPAYRSFMSEWVENCSINGRFHWLLYGQFVQASISLLNDVSQLVKSLLELSGPQDSLPSFDHDQIDDSESCYDSVNEWLSTLTSKDDARLVATDLQSHRNIGQDFPAQIFIEHLFELTEIRFERLFSKSAKIPRAILISSITTAVQAFDDVIRPHQLKLSQVYNFSVRRSPKRRAYSIATSDLGSPEAKRPRLSASVASMDNEDRDHTVPNTPQMIDRRTPSPTGSTVSLATTEGPTVTVAMLRALTRDLKKKYGAS